MLLIMTAILTFILSRNPAFLTGTLLKSNSFNSVNAKPKGKLVDKVVLQKHKSTRELASLNVKDGAIRSIGKSISFKSVKMLSPKSCGESYSLPSVSNNYEPKCVQSNCKTSTLSKSTSYVARRGPGMPAPLGELKMQSCALGVTGASSANGISNFTESSCCGTSALESTNLGEKIRDSSIYHSRLSIAAGGSAPAATWKTGDNRLIDPSDGKPFISDLPSHASSTVPFLLKMSIIPQHEYIWQGVFEVQSNRKDPELPDGIQEHLSTCASPKVLEVAKKFP
ncbi:RING/FYVE/PHD zinc finger superfamily protein [Actinidia rufa]|uniref:RING/FYVE/PHD zinc finger superfamily protein n=1 Tax=Actinidia rufa TaxID=165716 RepID=A0A7J0DDD5_9ERIC|nr:RING/FYVE/PHD zinc finger superfamily protein [Actinidia rufa]